MGLEPTKLPCEGMYALTVRARTLLGTHLLLVRDEEAKDPTLWCVEKVICYVVSPSLGPAKASSSRLAFARSPLPKTVGFFDSASLAFPYRS